MTESASRAFDPPRRILKLDEEDGITYALYREFAMHERAFHSRALSWPTEIKRVPPTGEVLASAGNNHSETVVFRRGLVLCHARVIDGLAKVSLAGPTADGLDGAERALRQLVPPPAQRPDDERSSLIRFWHRGAHGAMATSRRITVPDWSEIRGNYSSATVAGLDSLMDGWRPDESGQLLLWHGPPGTGKTYALRALTWQWRRWCKPHYIIDPEIFFGHRPDYMLEVLLEHPDEEDWINDDLNAQLEHDRQRLARWRLLILEDTGELLAADAKEREGQGLSRLLNLVDGLIGQGLRVLVLVTGNEPLRRLHPAISRPGRCASVVEFHPFGREEVRAWFADRHLREDGQRERTLADLFAALGGRVPRNEPRVGFV